MLGGSGKGQGQHAQAPSSHCAAPAPCKKGGDVAGLRDAQRGPNSEQTTTDTGSMEEEAHARLGGLPVLGTATFFWLTTALIRVCVQRGRRGGRERGFGGISARVRGRPLVGGAAGGRVRPAAPAGAGPA